MQLGTKKSKDQASTYKLFFVLAAAFALSGCGGSTVGGATASTDATLSALTLSTGSLSPAFAAATTSYTSTVSNATSAITVTPTATAVGAVIKVNTVTVTSATASGSIALSVGLNTITVLVTAPDLTTTKTYTIGVTRPPSSDATLSNLTISSGSLSPAFASGTTSYSVTVSNATTSVTVTPTVNDAGATVTVNTVSVTSGAASGGIGLSVGSNTITIEVTAADATTQAYTIDVTRSPAIDANLSSLAISSGSLSPAFASGTTAYTTTVANAVTTMTVTPTLSDPAATMTVNAVANASGVASGALGLSVGSGNTFTIVVTAADTVTTKTYTITVTRSPSSNADLSALTLSSGTLSPVFASGTTGYTATIANATTSITATATLADATATLTINTVGTASGVASAGLGMSVGSNTVTVVVTAEDGSTTKTYTVTVTRQSANADLSALVLSAGAISPAFDAATTAYTITVANGTTTTTVTPTKSHASATIKVNTVTVASGAASAGIGLSVGDTVITVEVTAEDTSITKNYVVTVHRTSNDADLSALVTSSGSLSPAFASGTLTYTVTIANATTSITVTPTVNYSLATVTVNAVSVASGVASGSLAMSPGPNTVTVVVTAEDAITTKTYTITVNREYSDGATLSDLVPSTGSISFDPNSLSYYMEINAATLTFTPTLTVGTGSITVDGVATADGVASAAIAVSPAQTKTVDIVTTSANGADEPNTLTYSVDVYRYDNDVALTAFNCANGTSFAPVFASGTTSYTCDRAGSTMQVSFTKSSVLSSVQSRVNGGSYTAANSSPKTVTLGAVGSSTVDFQVTAENGDTRIYTITVNRTSFMPAISFNKPIVATFGEELAAVAPLNKGGEIKTCAISPNLEKKTGLKFDTKTCAISGKPSTALSAGEYTVTASNDDGASPVKVNIGTNLPGLTLWLDDRGMQTDKIAKETLATWHDYSGRGNAVIQSIKAKQPGYLPKQLNGYPIARFDGEESFLYKNAFHQTKQAQSFSAFSVAQPGSKARVAKGLTEAPLLNLGAFHVPGTEGWSVYSLVSSASEAILWANRKEISRYTLEAEESRPYLTVGRGVDDREIWEGDMAEVLIYSRPLPTGERTLVEEYLTRKYKLIDGSATVLH